jgi:cell division protein FtsB
MPESMPCPECAAQGTRKTFKNDAGLIGHRRIVHGVVEGGRIVAEGGSGESGERHDSGGGGIKMSDTETFFPIQVWLPASLFSLYNYARRAGLSEHQTIIDFICEYTEFGFKKAHQGYGLTLAPVERTAPDGNNEEIKSLMAQQNALTAQMNNLSDKFERLLEEAKPKEEAVTKGKK